MNAASDSGDGEVRTEEERAHNRLNVYFEQLKGCTVHEFRLVPQNHGRYTMRMKVRMKDGYTSEINFHYGSGRIRIKDKFHSLQRFVVELRSILEAGQGIEVVDIHARSSGGTCRGFALTGIWFASLLVRIRARDDEVTIGDLENSKNYTGIGSWPEARRYLPEELPDKPVVMESHPELPVRYWRFRLGGTDPIRPIEYYKDLPIFRAKSVGSRVRDRSWPVGNRNSIEKMERVFVFPSRNSVRGRSVHSADGLERVFVFPRRNSSRGRSEHSADGLLSRRAGRRRPPHYSGVRA